MCPSLLLEHDTSGDLRNGCLHETTAPGWEMREVLPSRLRDHPQRHLLNNELHARPFVALSPPEQISHLAMHTGEDGAAIDYEHLVRCCERHAVDAPRPGVIHFTSDVGPFRLKWERHGEFVTYTFFRHGRADEPFRGNALDPVARDWFESLPGSTLDATHISLLPRDAPPQTMDVLARDLAIETLSGSSVAGGAATAFTDFRIHADGFSRIVIQDRGMGKQQAGRLVQRLLEIQTYRMMALLSVPLAREITPEIAGCERELQDATMLMREANGTGDERPLLDRLVMLSASVQRLSAVTNYRFRATRAYSDLVQQRLQEIREERIEGFQTFSEFMDRRFQPAMRTCHSMAERLDSISNGVTRASQILQTSVGTGMQEQSRVLLHSVNERAGLQIRLQEMVEGLSVVAITYYSLGLLSYAFRAASPFWAGLDAQLATGLVSPFLLAGVWLFLRAVRKRCLSTIH